MKKTIALTVATRAATENVKDIRKKGGIPAVVYGNKTPNTMVQCSFKEFHGVYMKAGENTLVELELDGKKIPSLVHAVSFEPVTDAYEHVDFYAVDMTKKVTTHVPVVVEGESLAVKSMGGVLVTVHDHVTVSCLPTDIPSSFVVNISVLEKFRDSITVGKLQIPQGVTIVESPETVLITIQEPRAEEVIAPVATTTTEGVAGAAPAADGAAPAATDKASPATAQKGPADKKEEKKK